MRGVSVPIGASPSTSSQRFVAEKRSASKAPTEAVPAPSCTAKAPVASRATEAWLSWYSRVPAVAAS
jgi:hypothetical protein